MAVFRSECLADLRWNTQDLEVLALRTFGGIRPYLIGVMCLSMADLCLRMTAVLLGRDEEQRAYLLDNMIARREGLCLLKASSQFRFWGEYQPLIQLLAENRVELWPALLEPTALAGHIADAMGEHVAAVEKASRGREKALEQRVFQLDRELKEVSRKLKRHEGQNGRGGESGWTTVAPVYPDLSDRVAQLTKQAGALSEALGKSAEQNKELRAFLDSILQEEVAVESECPAALSKDELKDLKGIIIGGHQNFTHKLRKLMPHCLFYSSEQKRIDAAAFPDRDFVLFFTTYCNHSLTDNALRECRLYDIPVGYSTHVNLDLFLADVARLARTRPKQGEGKTRRRAEKPTGQELGQG